MRVPAVVRQDLDDAVQGQVGEDDEDGRPVGEAEPGLGAGGAADASDGGLGGIRQFEIVKFRRVKINCARHFSVRSNCANIQRQINPFSPD